jgi:LmbE family N-acetylglucosaminyl deacetylase
VTTVSEPPDGLLAHYDAVYLSPHLDDAVLSCGGQIHRRLAAGERVLVATVGSADEPPPPWPPLVASLHRAWGLGAEVVAARRREDEAACRELGAHWLHLGLPEAIYRRTPGDGVPFYPTLASLFTDVAPGDQGFDDEIVEALRRLPPFDQLVVPLGAGGHVDHALIRRAAEALTLSTLVLYEEFPYAARGLFPRHRRWRRLAGPGATPRVVPLDPPDLDARFRAILAYASQVAPLFGTPDRLRRRLRRHTRQVGGERIWTLP